MNATDLLRAQHRHVERLMAMIADTSDRERQIGMFDELARTLTAHAAIERELFYPACAHAGASELVGKALADHSVVEFCLYEASLATHDPTFRYRVDVLGEALLNHVLEEEEDLFPKMEKALGRDHLDALGVEMQDRFDQLRYADYLGPLVASLRRALHNIESAKTRTRRHHRHGRAHTTTAR